MSSRCAASRNDFQSAELRWKLKVEHVIAWRALSTTRFTEVVSGPLWTRCPGMVQSGDNVVGRARAPSIAQGQDLLVPWPGAAGNRFQKASDLCPLADRDDLERRGEGVTVGEPVRYAFGLEPGEELTKASWRVRLTHGPGRTRGCCRAGRGGSGGRGNGWRVRRRSPRP